MHLKSLFLTFSFSTFFLVGCLAYSPSGKVPQENITEEPKPQTTRNKNSDIVLLHNAEPVTLNGDPTEPVFRINIQDKLVFNKNYSKSEVTSSLCALSKTLSQQYPAEKVQLYMEAIDKLILIFLSEKDIDLPLVYPQTNCDAPHYDRKDLLPVTEKTYESWLREGVIDAYSPLTYLSWKDVHSEFQTSSDEQSELERETEVLRTKYSELEEKNNNNYKGSLFVKLNAHDYTWDKEGNQAGNRLEDRYYPQNVCALQKNGSISRSTLGYRAFGKDILSEALEKGYEAYERQKQAEFRITGNGKPLSFYKTFDSLDDAYQYFSDIDYDARGVDWSQNCAIFIGVAPEVARLSTALADDDISSVYGRLISVTETKQHAAVAQGFQSHNEFKFVTEEDLVTKWAQLHTLRQYNVNTPEGFKGLKDEIIASKYTEDNLSIGVILDYLEDRQAARDNNTDVFTEKNQRLAQQAQQQKKQEDNAARRQAELEKNFPYIATLSCEFQRSHTNIAACFLGGKYSTNTQLELNNGNANQIYQGYELNRAGRESRNGLLIDLTRSFKIQAQNASDYLSLRLKIVERNGGKVVFEDIVSQYGVISIRN